MSIDPQKARQVVQEEIRKILFAAPETQWQVHDGSIHGASFTLASEFELGAVDRAFGGTLRRGGMETTGNVARRSRVWTAGDFLRIDNLPGDRKAPATRTLEHPKFGGVYLDLTDRTYLHFSPSQLPAAKLPDAAKHVRPEWAITADEDVVVLSARGVVALDVEIAIGGKAPLLTVRAVLAACLPDIARLGDIGLPLTALEECGMPRAVTVWLVDRNGKRATRLASHRIAEIESGPIPPDTFRIPEGFRDLRQRRDKAPKWYPIHRGKYQPMRPRKPARQRTAKAFAVAAAPAMMQFAPFDGFVPPKAAIEPDLPSCLPSTLNASCAYEIRQSLVDTVGYFLDMMGRRLNTVTGARTGHRDDVKLTIDWLDQMQMTSDSMPVGDGLFCLLRDVPPRNDQTGGGQGLLDRLAASMAADLLAADAPLPLGGANDPITLEQAVIDEITAKIADDTIGADARFDTLSPDSKAAVREAVLAKRIATVDYTFDGNFGESVWPREEFDLVHIKQRLDEIAITFEDVATVQKLTITVDNDGRPHIDFALSLASIDAVIHMERWPGLWFWLLAPETLVAAGIVVGITAAAVAGVIIATLMGLGPFGLMILFAMLSAAPIAAIGEITGGLLFLAALTYLVWDVTALHLQVTDAVLSSSVAPDVATDPEEVVLDPDEAKLDGTITVSASSEIPSGIHQLFDWIVNSAIGSFDRQVREQIEKALVRGLEGAFRKLPHFRLPLPERISVGVPFNSMAAPGVVAPGITSVSVDVPRHRLQDVAANGVKDSLLSATALTTMEFPFSTLCPFLTQVDQDGRDRLSQLIEALVATGSNPLFGYAISQNLLNGIVFGRWIGGRYIVDYDDNQIAEAFDNLVAVCPECDALTDRDVHVWAAAAPQVQVTSRAFDEDERHPYLSVTFPDVRLCIGGTAGKPSLLEVEFSITSIAHVAFGTENSNGKGWSLLTVDRNFLHVLFDERRDVRQLSPAGTQGIETRGPGFAVIADMDASARLQFLNDIQPILDAAARRLLRRENATGITFVDGSDSVSRQIYDSIFAIDLVPRRASIYATCVVSGPAAQAMPHRDDTGTVVGMFDTMTCAQGRNLRGQA